MTNKVMEEQMPTDYLITVAIIVFCGIAMVWLMGK